jgi:hypothetical protein
LAIENAGKMVAYSTTEIITMMTITTIMINTSSIQAPHTHNRLRILSFL